MPEEFYDSHNAGGEWGTPPELVRPLIDALGQELFDLDPASGAEPEPYAKTQYTVKDNGLRKEWFGHVWLNPPYGRGINRKWAKKAYQESLRDDVDSITALVPNSSGTPWFLDYYAKADLKVEIEGKVSFIGPQEHGPTFYSTFIVFDIETLPSDYIKSLRGHGSLWIRPNDIGDIQSASEVDW